MWLFVYRKFHRFIFSILPIIRWKVDGVAKKYGCKTSEGNRYDAVAVVLMVFNKVIHIVRLVFDIEKCIIYTTIVVRKCIYYRKYIDS